MLRSLRPSIVTAAALLLACTSEPADESATASATASNSGTTGDATTSTTTATEVTSTAATDASATAATSSTGDPLVLGDDALIPVFEGEHVYFGDVNRRQVDVTVDLPEDGEYDAITLSFALDCPNGLCDHWDRYGTFGVVRWPGAEDEGYVELTRFITAYRLPASWELDLTDLRPLLKGETTLRVFIDTWVGPGHAQGDGWLVDASLDFHGGVPSPRAIDVQPLWYQSFAYGDPMSPVDQQVLAQSFTPPAEASAFAVRSHVTGHGFGNLDNCAEFCPRSHGYQLNGAGGYARTVWRDNCTETAVPDQLGTWTYPRAGWCPGADVIPWTFDVTADVTPGAENTILYAVDDYENTCRPESAQCMGCSPGVTCDDGHSLPYYYMSAVLIAYD